MKQIERHLDGVLTMKDLGEIYFEDGAADGTIVMQPPDYKDEREELIQILRCEGKAARVLIGHLDDTRLTTAKFKGGSHWSEPIRVSIGFICLDLLLAGLSPFGSTVRDPKTENDDGLGAGFRSEFYFRPDSYRITSRGYEPRPEVLRVKRAWERALAEGRLRFQYGYWRKVAS